MLPLVLRVSVPAAARPGTPSAASWVHFLCVLCPLHNRCKKSFLHFAPFLHRVPPPPPPAVFPRFCCIYAFYSFYFRFSSLIGKPAAFFRLAGKGWKLCHLSPCSVGLIGAKRNGKTEKQGFCRVALPLLCGIRNASRLLRISPGTEREAGKLFLWFCLFRLYLLFLFFLLLMHKRCKKCIFDFLPHSRCQPSRVSGSSGTP